MELKTCQHPDGCPRQMYALGWCEMHYIRVRKNGNPGTVEGFYEPPRDTCKHPDGCSRPVRTLGWCGMHYNRVWKNGDPGPVGSSKKAPGDTCKHPDGCLRPMKTLGWCSMHYERIRKGGDLGPVGSVKKAPGDTCKHPDGCLDPPYALGWCKMHYARVKKNGIPGPIKRQKAFPGQSEWQMNPQGYLVRYQNNVKISQHRFVMEEYLNRELISGENIHHINGVRTDNRIENLELWITNQPQGQRPADLVAWAHEILDRYELELPLYV